MAKTLKEAPITTANARAKLSAGLHWRSLDPDVHLGYRKGRRGGVWLVRWRSGVGYRQKPIGTAADAIKEGTLDFNAAVKTARKEVAAARLEAKAVADGPVLTVGLATNAMLPNVTPGRASELVAKFARTPHAGFVGICWVSQRAENRTSSRRQH
jgi:hypothetical protein